ncbi:MAG: NAD(P)-dependent dehydrogenase (short-subunit alcohol dehydrogenase family) [Myxococcota bacterium]|jgi:NAD(P)-dependent dehydrogenase (short-subunit alcohol dehydrogenase family)
MSKSNKTALVTGANSGLGFEAAAQLASDGWGTVILACRSVAKAEAAAAALTERTGKSVWQALAIDTSEVGSANAAADQLKERGVRIDFLLLNAGASGETARFNSAKQEITYASTLVGHHVLTMRALSDGLLASNARIVIAGSEGARGTIPGMPLHDISQIAKDSYDGDRVATIAALMKLETPGQKKFVNMGEYVTAKLIVAWWVAGLSSRLPAGTTVNAMSPGAAVGTSFGRNAPAAMRYIMMPMMKLLGPLLGMNGPTDKAARRYLDAAEFGDEINGQFWATAHEKKLVGPIGVQTSPAVFLDSTGHKAAFDAMVQVTGVGLQDAVRAA